MNDSPVPLRALTAGPRYHWFGYYDKLQFDPCRRRVLGMAVDFENRSPAAEDTIQVGMIDLQAGDRWIELGSSRAWCWQQGCMLQWRPGSDSEVVWNDRIPVPEGVGAGPRPYSRQEEGAGEQFVCHVLDVETGRRRTLPQAIYTLSPDGRTALGTDFRRINHLRPGYGYAGLPAPNVHVAAPDDVGIYRMDMETGAYELIVSIAQIAAIPYSRADLSAARHWFNHLLFNTDGTRFIFLHRWRIGGQPGFGTRMMTAAVDGSDIHVVDDYGHTSHFIWRDPQHILAWAYHPSHGPAFYLYADGEPQVEVVGPDAMVRNGHCTYLPGNEWILNDAYPDEARYQELYLYHVRSGKKVPLGKFYAPEAYEGEWRCDLHPRFSPDGRWVTIDSAHGGQGRQIYLLDIGSLV